MVIDGRAIAREIIEYLGVLPKPQKTLAAVLIGDDPSSLSFLKKKKEIADELDVNFTLYQYSSDKTETETLELFRSVCKNENIGGVILQLPLPEGFDRAKFVSLIPKEKDVDNLTGESSVLAPAVLTTKVIIERTNTVLQDSVVAVVGKGRLVGGPIIEWLRGKCKSLLVLDRSSGLEDLEKANVVISGVGQAGLIKPEGLRRGAGVIDFGYSPGNQGGLQGDFDSSASLDQVAWYTPTPGGTGPVLVVELFKNFYELNKDGS